jgi:hypothetical protein
MSTVRKTCSEQNADGADSRQERIESVNGVLLLLNVCGR